MSLPDFNQMTIREIARYCKVHENKIRGRMHSNGGKIRRSKQEAAYMILGLSPDLADGTGFSEKVARKFHNLTFVKPEYWSVVY